MTHVQAIDEGASEEGEGGAGDGKMSVNKNFLKRLMKSTMFRRNAQADREANEACVLGGELEEDENEDDETMPELIDVEAEIADHGEEVLHQAHRIRHRKGVVLLRRIASMYGVRIRIIS